MVAIAANGFKPVASLVIADVHAALVASYCTPPSKKGWALATIFFPNRFGRKAQSPGKTVQNLDGGGLRLIKKEVCSRSRLAIVDPCRNGTGEQHDHKILCGSQNVVRKSRLVVKVSGRFPKTIAAAASLAELL